MLTRITTGARSAVSTLITVLLLAGVLIPTGAILGGTGSELFITEYVEGSGTNRAIELYNPTDNAISLGASGYMLAFYYDGDSTIDSGVPLAGTIQPGATFVVTPTNAGASLLALANQKFGTSWFDGNDAVALVHSGTAIDVIGQIGMDPGTAWGTGSNSTVDHTLRRDAAVNAGDPDGSDAFDPSVQWTAYPVDTFDGLGNVNERQPNEPVSISCPAPFSTTEGTPGSAAFSATDPDGMVSSLAVDAVTPSGGAFSVTDVTAAVAVGGTATGTLRVGAATPQATYTVTLLASNQDASPQTASCDVTVTVNPAPPPPPPSIDTLRELVDEYLAGGALEPSKSHLLTDRLDRAAADLAAGHVDAYRAQLQALGNQAEGLAPQWLAQDAADAINAMAAELAATS